MQKLISELKEQRASSLQLEPAQKDELVVGLRLAVTKTLSEEFLRAVDDHYSAAAFRQSSHAKLLEDFDALRRRLLQEISTLQRRANSNLSIGSIITLLAMGSLAYVVLGASHEFRSSTDLMSYYIPRVTFVIFIEVFSFFFLRLYKANLLDVKFYQNELTNVESKLIALKAALIENRDEGLAHILEELGRTERNFVLKKDETTVELERGRLEAEKTKGFVDSVSALVEKLRPGK